MSTMTSIQQKALAFKRELSASSGMMHDLDYSKNELLSSLLSTPGIRNRHGISKSASILVKA